MEELAEQTKAAVEAIISKPKMTTKLLMKPPFRFLHDTIIAIINKTQFADGLYNDSEKASENVKAKDAKTAFLDKMINCVGICLGQPLEVRSIKVVAGAEPDKTNIFLQSLARAALDPNVNSADAVQRTLAGETPSSSGGAREESKAEAKSEAKQSKEDDSGSKAAAEEARRAEEEEQARKEEARRRRAEQKRAAAEAAAAEEKAAAEAKSAAEEKSAAPAPSSGGGGGATAEQLAEIDGTPERSKMVLEQLVAKPKPSVKLLGKPPFRFLHDLISELMRQTGWGADVYSEEEKDSANVKNREQKVAYLQKLIDGVQAHLGVEVEARPSKIVAGLEPELTNKLLQMMVLATQTPPSSGGGSAPAAAAAPAPAPAAAKDDDSGMGAEAKRPPRSRKSDASDHGGTAAAAASSAAAAVVAEPERAAAKDERGGGGGRRGSREEMFGGGGAAAKAFKGEEAEEMQQQPVGGGEEAEGKDDADGKVGRPTTARRRPPRLQSNVRAVEPTVGAQPGGGAGEAGKAKHIMVEGQQDEDSEDEEELGAGATGGGGADLMGGGGGGARTKLVQDIMAENKQQQKEAQQKEEKAGGNDRGGGGIRMGRVATANQRRGLKNKGFSNDEISQLRVAIQTLCQSTNPLGKCMDYVHDDLESMNKELEEWRAEYRKKSELLEEEAKTTEEGLQTLQLQLVEVEEQVKEQVVKINGVKASIAKNDVRIEQLLRMVVSV